MVVTPPSRPRIADLSDIRFRMETVTAGARLSFVVFAAGIAYSLATWDLAHRGLMAVLFCVLAGLGLIALQLPTERIVRGRWREWFFVAWSVAWIAITAASVAADGGVESPLAVLFFLPVVFAALSYPPPSVAFVGGLSVLTLVVIGAIGGPADTVKLTFLAAALGLAAVICAWQAQNQEQRRSQLARISRADPLTGCLNRRGFEERISAELDEGLRTGRSLAIVAMDLDGFKQVNDSQGHAGGDELLCWTTDAMRETVRPMDSVGRLGGDEFAILLPGSGQADAAAAVERVGKALSPRVTAAMGVAAFPAHGVEVEQLMRHADAAVYAAKDNGRSRSNPHRRELSWAAALARAVDLRMAVSDSRCTRVSTIAAGIGVELGWSGPVLALLRMAALLQDVGKVSIPDRILRKGADLNDEELEELKRHPIEGAELVARVEGLDPILPWIRHSHEHFDGSGYPDGLAGESIPMASRILLVAKAFVAITSERPYREARGSLEAMEELSGCAGGQFDPSCVAALKRHLRHEEEQETAQTLVASEPTPLLDEREVQSDSVHQIS